MKIHFPNFDWLIFFNTIFEGITDKDDKTILFDESTEVVIYGVDFVRRLDRLLPQFNTRYIFLILNFIFIFYLFLFKKIKIFFLNFILVF